MKYYSKIISYCLVFTLLLVFTIYAIFGKNAEAKNLGVHGNVWEIKEENIVNYIKKQLAKQDTQKLSDEFQKSAEKQIIHPKPATNLEKTTAKTVHYFDPSITLTKDIADQKGKILHKKGTKINPLDHMDFTQTLLFIDGSDTKQVNYSKTLHKKLQNNLKIILLKGSPINLMKENQNMRFYFDQNQYLSQTFGIKTVPSLVKAEGNLIKIEGVVL